MSDEVCDQLAELDRLLNDPEVALQPARVWILAAEIAAAAGGAEGPGSRVWM